MLTDNIKKCWDGLADYMKTFCQLKLNRASQADGMAEIKTQQDLIWDACQFIQNPIHPMSQIILITNYQKTFS